MAVETSEEIQSMLPRHPDNYAKITKVKDVFEDIKNNNSTVDINSINDVQDILTQYSSNLKGVLAQCLVTAAMMLLAVGGGMPTGYSAVLLPQLEKNSSSVHVDQELRSWIASVHSLATPIGSLVSGPLLDLIGRRGCLQLSAVPLCCGWIIIGLAKDITTIIMGRIISGFAVGFMTVPIQAFVGETADPRLRGFLTSGALAAYCSGILLIYTFGAFFEWKTVAFSSTILPILAFTALLFVPESPAWLVRRKKVEAARTALLWLRGGNVKQTSAEITILEARTQADNERRALQVSFIQRTSSAISMICESNVLKPMIIINVFNALQLASGTYVVVFYAVDLMKDIGGEKIDKYLAAVATAIIRLIFCLFACVLIFHVGRRTLGIFSAIGTALTSLVLAGYTLIRSPNTSIDTYLIGTIFLTYVGVNTVGLLVLPGLMTGELLPHKARGVGGGCNFFFYNLLLFTIIKCFPVINRAVGTTGVFTIFGCCALLEAAFIYIALPETRNLALQEIEDYFQQNNILWITRPKEKNQKKILIDEASP